MVEHDDSCCGRWAKFRREWRVDWRQKDELKAHKAEAFPERGERVREFTGIKKAAERKLEILNNAEELVELLVPPGNKLEKLSGNRKGQHSLRINGQWRICFVWKKDGPHDVAITDYY